MSFSQRIFKKPKKKAFLMFEVVFAILLVGVAFGIFAYFYLQNSQLKRSLNILDSTQEQALRDLREFVNPKQTIITANDGKFCEGEMLEISQGDKVFKIFEPTNCDESAQ